MEVIGKVLGAIGLLLISIIFIPIGIIGAIYGVGEALWNRSLKRAGLKLSNFAKLMAVTIDVLLGVMASELLNDLFIKPSGYKIGKHLETVSSALGKNQDAKTLTKSGWVLVNILNWLDENHCIKSIDRSVR